MSDLIQQRKLQYIYIYIYIHTHTHTHRNLASFFERYINNVTLIKESADSSGVGLRPLASWDCRFESRQRPGYLSVVNVVCCEVDISALG